MRCFELVVSVFCNNSTRRSAFAIFCLLLSWGSGQALADDETVPWAHAISMHGSPALGPDQPFPYANENAPKGGTITLGVQGTFDSLNSFIVQGGWTSARGMRERQFGNNVLESLLGSFL